MRSCGIRSFQGTGVGPGDTAHGMRESHTTLLQCQGNKSQMAALIGEPVCRPHPSRAGTGADGARGMLRMVQAKGAGYAISREDELQATMCVAQATGEHVLRPFPAFTRSLRPFTPTHGHANKTGWMSRKVCGVLERVGEIGLWQPFLFLHVRQLNATCRCRSARAGAVPAASGKGLGCSGYTDGMRVCLVNTRFMSGAGPQQPTAARTGLQRHREMHQTIAFEFGTSSRGGAGPVYCGRDRPALAAETRSDPTDLGLSSRGGAGPRLLRQGPSGAGGGAGIRPRLLLTRRPVRQG